MTSAGKYQGGWSLLEVVLAGFLGLTLVLSGGYLFTMQIRGYQDIKDQAKMQANLKMSLQGMTRQISNAGAWLPDPLAHFDPGSRKLTFAYLDLRGRFCDENTPVIVSFYTRSGTRQDDLVKDITCPGASPTSRILATVPKGGLELSFRYLDKQGNFTTDPVLIKSVQLDLDMKTGQAVKRVKRSRGESIRVQCVNFI